MRYVGRHRMSNESLAPASLCCVGVLMTLGGGTD